MMVAQRQQDTDEEQWLTTDEAATYVGVTRTTIGEWCRAGTVRSHTERILSCDGRWRTRYLIPLADLAQERASVEKRRAARQRERLKCTEAATRRHLPGCNVEQPRQGDTRRGDPVLCAVCAVYDVQRADLEGTSVVPELAEMRRVAAYILHRDAGLSVAAVGRLLRRHHATIIHHLSRIVRHQTDEERWAIAEVRTTLAHGTGRG